jgi:hypothetical protein
MPFITKLDFSDNRQVKQNIETNTVLSGATSFGVPFSQLPSGPDPLSSAITATQNGLVSTFSGNSTTTVYSWFTPIMALADSVLSAWTPSNSATTQNTGNLFSASTSTIIDGNTVNLTYTGVSFDVVPIAMVDLGGGNYSGTVNTNVFDTLSAGTIDFTGRTIWVDVSGITKTQDLIVSNTPIVGFVLTCLDTEGKVGYQPITGVTSTATTYWSASTGPNAISMKESDSLASGNRAVSEGYLTTASGNYSRAQNWQTSATTTAAHAEGYQTRASGFYSHAEGFLSIASGSSSHAEGLSTTAGGNQSHAQNSGTKALGASSHAEGQATTASGTGSHAEGSATVALGTNSHAEGFQTSATTSYAHSEGQFSLASGIGAHAEGFNTRATANFAHAEGFETSATTVYSHAEGLDTLASGSGAHAEGLNSRATGEYSHVEGASSTGSGDYSHAEGVQTTASGDYSHTEGTNTIASGSTSHAEGAFTTAGGDTSHAEGAGTTALGTSSHAQNNNTIALGQYSHAGGNTSIASGTTSFVHGNDSIAGGTSTIVLGSSITGTTADTTYVDRLNIKTVGAGPGTTDIGVDANGNVVNQASDLRLKQNISTIENALDKVKALRGVKYQWKDTVNGGAEFRLGFIAQEVDEVEPLLTFTDSKSVEQYMGVQYKDVTALLVEAVKELSSGTTSESRSNTYIETQTVIAEDNNIELNYNGDASTAVDGGISVLYGLSDGSAAELKIDANGNWVTNTGFKPQRITIPNYTPKSSKDSYGDEGDVTVDDNYMYIKNKSGWTRVTLNTF